MAEVLPSKSSQTSVIEDNDVPPLTDSESCSSAESSDSERDVDVSDNEVEELPATRDRVADGSRAYLSGLYKIAASHYQAALEEVLKKPKNEQPDDIQFTLLKYALGMTEINIGTVKNAQNGLQYFNQILETFPEAVHLIGQLGIATAYFKQNRFADAIKPLQECLSLMERYEVILPFHWPGTSEVVEDFSSVTHLKDHLDDLLSQCKTPPEPDAVCRSSSCSHCSRQIYYTDLECEGFVSVHCEEKCEVEYHMDCWKQEKSSTLNKRSDKLMLNTSCLTPDCKQPIVRIKFRDNSGNVFKEVASESIDQETKQKKASTKQKHSSKPAKALDKKKDKGRKEKVVKFDASSFLDTEKPALNEKSEKCKDSTEDKPVTNVASSEQEVAGGNSAPGSNSFPILPPDATNFVAIRKKAAEDEEFIATKQKKGKRLRDRVKPVVVNLDEFASSKTNDSSSTALEKNETEDSPPFSFEARNTRGWYGGEFDNEYCDIPFSSYKMPSLPSLSSCLSSSEAPKTLKRNLFHDKSAMTKAEIKEKVFSRFESLLTDNGPLHPEDDVVQEELSKLNTETQLLVHETGGITKVLQESLKFAVVDGLICILRDSHRARALAQGRRQNLLLSTFGLGMKGKDDALSKLTAPRSAVNGKEDLMTKLVSTGPGISKKDELLSKLTAPGALTAPGSGASRKDDLLSKHTAPGPGALTAPGSGASRKDDLLSKLTAPGPGANRKDELLSKLTAPGPGASRKDELLSKLTAPGPGANGKGDLLSKLTAPGIGANGKGELSSKLSQMGAEASENMERLFKLNLPPLQSRQLSSSSTSSISSGCDGPKNSFPVTSSSLSPTISLTPGIRSPSAIASVASSNSQGGSSIFSFNASNVLKPSHFSVPTVSGSALTSPTLWNQSPIRSAQLSSPPVLHANHSPSHSTVNSNLWPSTSLNSSPPSADVWCAPIGSGLDSDKSVASPLATAVEQFAFIKKVPAPLDLKNPLTAIHSDTDNYHSAGEDMKAPPVPQASSNSDQSQGITIRPNNDQNQRCFNLEDLSSSDELYCSDEELAEFDSCSTGNCGSSDDANLQPELSPQSVGAPEKSRDNVTDEKGHAMSSALSVTAAEFVPPGFMYLYAKSPSSGNVTESRPAASLPAAKEGLSCKPVITMADKAVETDENWKLEIENLKGQVSDMNTKYSSERETFERLLDKANEQLSAMEKSYEDEKIALVTSWKLEKNQLDEQKGKLEEQNGKLQQDLTLMGKNLETTYHQVLLHEQKQNELVTLLVQEQQKSRALQAECEKLLQFKKLFESSQSVPSTLGTSPPFPQVAFNGGVRGPAAANTLFQPQPPASGLSTLRGPPSAIRGPAPVLNSTLNPPAAVSSASNGATMPSAESGRSKQNLEKILNALSTSFPDIKRSDLNQYVQEVRASRNNTLSGLPMQKIVSLVSDVIQNRKLQSRRQMVLNGPPGLTGPGSFYGYASGGPGNSGPGSCISGGYSGAGSLAGDSDMFDEDNTCIICHEDLTPDMSTTLDCKHTYHSKCIRMWFKEQSTCPTCRNHSLLCDEFPPLGRSAFAPAVREPQSHGGIRM